MDELLAQIRNCRVCEKQLPNGVNPVISASPRSKIIIIGQAPGRKVHQTGIPWDDKSGENLRSWMGIDESVFYDMQQIALMPMGFCYPGTGNGGDLPPRPECAPLWHKPLLERMPQLQLMVLIGQYAQNYYLGKNSTLGVTERVKQYKQFLPKYFPLPHPSPRNNIWQAKNPWFGTEVLPGLKSKILEILNHKT